MTSEELLASLQLPSSAHVGKRVPKKFLLDAGVPTSADKRYVNQGIEELSWEAVLKPTTVGLSAYTALDRNVAEIAVLRVVLRDKANSSRLHELIHRMIPYPLFLVASESNALVLSLASKRWSQNEATRVVLDGELQRIRWDDTTTDSQFDLPFRKALTLQASPWASLYHLYQGWMDALTALQVARRTGVFQLLSGADRNADRREALRLCQELEAEIEVLRNQAGKERQMARRVELNLKIQQSRKQLELTKQLL